MTKCIIFALIRLSRISLIRHPASLNSVVVGVNLNVIRVMRCLIRVVLGLFGNVNKGCIRINW